MIFAGNILKKLPFPCPAITHKEELYPNRNWYYYVMLVCHLQVNCLWTSKDILKPVMCLICTDLDIISSWYNATRMSRLPLVLQIIRIRCYSHGFGIDWSQWQIICISWCKNLYKIEIYVTDLQNSAGVQTLHMLTNKLPTS